MGGGWLLFYCWIEVGFVPQLLGALEIFQDNTMFKTYERPRSQVSKRITDFFDCRDNGWEVDIEIIVSISHEKGLTHYAKSICHLARQGVNGSGNCGG
jgi:hypothetical protein